MQDSKFSEIAERASLRGVKFIYKTASATENFRAYAFDYLWAFYCIWSTSVPGKFQRAVFDMGQQMVRRWNRSRPRSLTNLDADDLTHLVFASYACYGFGATHDSLRTKIAEAVKRFGPIDYFWFDPKVERPPLDVPDECACEATNSRGQTTCSECSEQLTMMSPYEIWIVALIRSYLGEKYGVKLGARYLDVLKWLPVMRPYPSVNTADFIWSIYAVTHVVYTLNDYGSCRLSSDWLPQEFEFLESNLSVLIALQDFETLGEVVDSLKSFGFSEQHPGIRQAMEYLLSVQNSDGSWGEKDLEDVYYWYHPTLTAVNALRRYAWDDTRLSFPRLRSYLRNWAVS